MSKTRVVYTLIAVLILSTLFAGCNERTKVNETTGTKDAISGTYPIQTNEKLTYWVTLSPNASANAKTLNETPLAKELIKKTGINVEYIHPMVGQETTQFNMMIASNDLPDIVESDWYNLPGGPDKAIDENTIISLNTLIDKACPNLKKMYDKIPNAAKQMKTDKGNYYMFPFIREDDILKTFAGGMIRKDLLDKIGQPAPETIAEWETVLKLLKANGVNIPLSIKLDNASLKNNNIFIGAFGIAGDFYVENDKVKFGPYEPKYADFITLMSKWYNMGLLDKNFVDGDSKRVASIVASGETGAVFGAAGGEFGKWIPALKQKVPEAEFVPVKYPVMEKGERPKFGQKEWDVHYRGAAIAGSSKNAELAAKFLDYGYSEEGHMLYNFGIEGESYNMKDDIPTYTDIITDPNKNGNLTVAQAMFKYIRANGSGPFVQDKNYLFQYYTMDVQKKAISVWSDTDTLLYKMPFVFLTDDESNEFSKIINDINTYRQEFLYKTIIGVESTSKISSYFETMKKMGIERAIEIQQAAYDRFKKR